jgi:hypothetical protein
LCLQVWWDEAAVCGDAFLSRHADAFQGLLGGWKLSGWQCGMGFCQSQVRTQLELKSLEVSVKVGGWKNHRQRVLSYSGYMHSRFTSTSTSLLRREQQDSTHADKARSAVGKTKSVFCGVCFFLKITYVFLRHVYACGFCYSPSPSLLLL